MICRAQWVSSSAWLRDHIQPVAIARSAGINEPHNRTAGYIDMQVYLYSSIGIDMLQYLGITYAHEPRARPHTNHLENSDIRYRSRKQMHGQDII